MSAFVVVDLTPTNRAKLEDYSVQAAGTIAAYGGRFVAKGPAISLHGAKPFEVKVLIEFPTAEAANNWYYSDAYQKLIDTRDQGMISRFQLVG